MCCFNIYAVMYVCVVYVFNMCVWYVYVRCVCIDVGCVCRCVVVYLFDVFACM